jgi:glycosyltransferase involved in cell wall biosynthesis
MMNQPTAPLRILMTTDTYGGVWDYSYELVSGLASYGVQTVLAVIGPPLSPWRRSSLAVVPGLHLHEANFDPEWLPGSEDDLHRTGEWLLQLQDRYAPDLIHLNSYAHGNLPWQAPLLMVAHSCVFSWWQAVKKKHPPEAWRGYRQRVEAGLEAADVVVAPTAAFLARMQAIYGALPAARVIVNGRNPSLFQPSAKDPLILSAGRLWDEAKNINALDAIAADLPWPVAVAGDWRRPDGGGNPPSNLHCLGWLATQGVARWMSRAAIYALPARYEPFGLTVLEAAMSGCALVLGDIPTLRELWNGAAAFVPPDDQDALRQALQGLIGDPLRRQQAGEAAQMRARRYAAETMVGSYHALYAEMRQTTKALKGHQRMQAPAELRSTISI